MNILFVSLTHSKILMKNFYKYFFKFQIWRCTESVFIFIAFSMGPMEENFDDISLNDILNVTYFVLLFLKKFIGENIKKSSPDRLLQ